MAGARGRYATAQARGVVAIHGSFEDPFLAFYYRFVLPNLSAIQAGHGRMVYKDAVAPLLDRYVSEWFEVICRQWLRFYAQERLPSVARTVGKIWAGDYDIDVAGELLDGSHIAGKCKWRREPMGAGVLRELQTRATASSFYSSSSGKRFYLLFSRSAAAAELRQLAAKDNSIVFLGPSELLGSRRRRRS
jgi:uncharacterized protein